MHLVNIVVRSVFSVLSFVILCLLMTTAHATNTSFTLDGFSISCGDPSFQNSKHYTILENSQQLVEVSERDPNEGFTINSESHYFESGFNFQVYIAINAPGGEWANMFIRCPRGGLGSRMTILETKSDDGKTPYELRFTLSINGPTLTLSDIEVSKKHTINLGSIIMVLLE